MSQASRQQLVVLASTAGDIVERQKAIENLDLQRINEGKRTSQILYLGKIDQLQVLCPNSRIEQELAIFGPREGVPHQVETGPFE
jgi:hypothetical protein